jgi:beta-xylosidase
VGSRVEFKAPRRSLDQNALMWSRLTDISQQVEWYGQKLTAEDWKDVMSASLRKCRVVPGIDAGTFVPLGMRTSDMSKAEMADLLELIAAFGAERGVKFGEE